MLAACVLALSSWDQTASAQTPRFEDYPVAEIFKNEPVPPQRRIGYNNIKWVTNFAGHYMVIQWAPGGDHLILDIFDTKTGRVFTPPLFPKRFVSPDCPNCTPTNPLNYGGADFRLNSRLMVLERACPNDRLHYLLQFVFLGCSKYYFLLENDSFKLLR